MPRRHTSRTPRRGGFLPVLLPVGVGEAEALDLVVQRPARDAEQPRGVLLNPIGAFQRLHDQIPLRVLQPDPLRGQAYPLVPELRPSPAKNRLRSAVVMRSPSAMRTARSIVFSSSRMLPGQWYSVSIRIAPGSMLRTFLPISAAYFDRKN